MANSTKSEKMKLAPLRSLNDFLLDSKRYQSPPFNDLKRFNNRVTSNLLYFQTNYLSISMVVFSIFLLLQFNRLVAGVIGVAFTAATALFAQDRLPQLSSLKAQYPIAPVVAFAVNLLVLYLVFRPMLFLALVVLVPVVFWIAHASTRSRGIKNKVNNKMEQLGAQVYSNTPMEYGLLLLGIEAKDYDE